MTTVNRLVVFDIDLSETGTTVLFPKVAADSKTTDWASATFV